MRSLGMVRSLRSLRKKRFIPKDPTIPKDPKVPKDPTFPTKYLLSNSHYGVIQIHNYRQRRQPKHWNHHSFHTSCRYPSAQLKGTKLSLAESNQQRYQVVAMELATGREGNYSDHKTVGRHDRTGF